MLAVGTSLVKPQPAKVFSIDITLIDVHMNWLNVFYLFILEGSLRVIVIDCMIAFLVTPCLVGAIQPCME